MSRARHRDVALRRRRQDDRLASARSIPSRQRYCSCGSSRGRAWQAALPNFLTEKEIASGALVALMKSYPLPEAGLFIVRPPGHHPARKVRLLTELLIEHFG